MADMLEQMWFLLPIEMYKLCIMFQVRPRCKTGTKTNRSKGKMLVGFTKQNELATDK